VTITLGVFRLQAFIRNISCVPQMYRIQASSGSCPSSPQESRGVEVSKNRKAKRREQIRRAQRSVFGRWATAIVLSTNRWTCSNHRERKTAHIVTMEAELAWLRGKEVTDAQRIQEQMRTIRLLLDVLQQHGLSPYPCILSVQTNSTTPRGDLSTTIDDVAASISSFAASTQTPPGCSQDFTPIFPNEPNGPASLRASGLFSNGQHEQAVFQTKDPAENLTFDDISHDFCMDNGCFWPLDAILATSDAGTGLGLCNEVSQYKRVMQ